MKTIVSLAVVSALLLLSTFGSRVVMPTSASPLEVFPGESIQNAINSAPPGDTIFVHAGTYHEHVEINKVVALVGENRVSTIIDGKGTGTVVKVTADNVNISGFTMQGSTRGIELYNCSNIAISGNIVKGNMQYGIFLENSTNTIISDNMVLNNGDRGVYLRSSNNNTVDNNTISKEHSEYGILLIYSQNNVVSNNTISNITGWTGIRVESSSNNFFSQNVISKKIHILLSPRNTLRNNNLSSLSIDGSTLYHFIQDIDPSNIVSGKPICYWVNQHNKQVPSNAGYVALVNSTNITVKDLNIVGNDRGILFFSTINSTIMNVSASHNSKSIELLYSSQNNIYANTITNNSFGVFLDCSSNNSVFGNTITNNEVGIFFLWSNNTIFYNNFISNTKQVEELISSNVWDKGYPSGGNYWSDYDATDVYNGLFQNETGSDGIGDTTYDQDNYPLMGTFSDFSATSEVSVQTICNSTISNFHFNGSAISFDVSNENDTTGFCRICIPTALISDTYKIFVNGSQVPYTLLPSSNSTHNYLYFTYNHSTQEVVVTPEFPTWTSMPLLFVVLTIAIIIYKRRLLKKPMRACMYA